MLKRIFFLFLWLLLFFNTAYAKEILNVYNWTGYMPAKELHQFEKQTGITVNYSTFDDNEALYTKIKSSPHADYDIIIPSNDYIDKMRKEGLLHRLNHSKLSNIKYLNPVLLNRRYDPHNHYSLPYLWGTTGLAINSHVIDPKRIKSWSMLWDKRFKDQLMLPNNAREVFSVALKTLGFSINDTNPKHIATAYEKLKTLTPNIKLFNEQATQTVFMDDEIYIGVIINGGAYLASKYNSKILYLYPKEGVILWIDNLAIPKNAPHLKNAYKFINFILQPNVAKTISLETGFASPNQAAVKLMPQAIQHNRILYPTKKDLQHSEIEMDVGKANALYQQYWEYLKINAG